MSGTELAQALARVGAAPGDDSARMALFGALADAELCLLLTAPLAGDQISPEVVDLDGAGHVLVFETETRLADHARAGAPYASLPGRALALMLAGQGLGIAINPGLLGAAMISAAEVDWLAQTLAQAPEAEEARLLEIARPVGIDPKLVLALTRKLSRAAGMAGAAYLVAATYDDGSTGHVLAFVDVDPRAEAPVAHTAGEALAFSGVELGRVDVMFVGAGDAVTDRLRRVGLPIEVPQVAAPADPPGPSAPGSDPGKPPKLR